MKTQRKPHIQYEDALVSFTDILGFKNIVEDCTAAKISRILGRFKLKAKFGVAAQYQGKSRQDAFISFSDLTIQTIPLRKPRRDIRGAISGHLRSLASLQCELLSSEQVVLRGGLTVGQIVKSYNTVWAWTQPGVRTREDIRQGTNYCCRCLCC